MRLTGVQQQASRGHIVSGRAATAQRDQTLLENRLIAVIALIRGSTSLR
jgi:hypothetical protein